MASSELPFGIDRSRLRLDGRDPYLCLHFVIVFVRDQERSLRFFADKLNFRVMVDHTFEDGNRWIEVAPPDGTAQLGIALATPGSDREKLIGGPTDIYFITEDLPGKYKEWSERGVHFQFPPEVPAWGGIHSRFEDPDGNSYGLVGFDELTRGVEAHRRALTEKLESERRTAQELEIAKQVQSRLFPQIHPEAKTLEYAGLCLPARQVGGDYFDFLDLGQHKLGQHKLGQQQQGHQQLGLVIGDVSGKGIAAALLMANLQANLRSQSALALDRPELLLQSVNRLFYENTIDSAYASLFFALYDDHEQRLRYANCGHLSGLVLRADNTCQRLDSTGTLLGLFPQWDCSIGECTLFPGDILALYTDGITEAYNDAGEEFGEQSLIERLRQHRDLPCHTALTAIAEKVRSFNSREQHDDITLILAKCKARD
jgi:serine phosphatase RsbU (regulator of sigma subunit)/catechol 2,3-dioxygenase-like lactoylglutathione lyase family enzyme